MFSPLIQQLIDSLKFLPGVGPKSAQRMAFYLLERQREKGLTLSKALQEALTQVGRCQRCYTFCETPLCELCSNTKRNQALLCVVETPADVIAIEQTNSYFGLYFVLMGHLSPLDGIGPNEIGMKELEARIKQNEITEIILATNPTIEGEATAHYIVNLVKNEKIQCSRIAHGVPLGGELEYLDGGTLARSLQSRQVITGSSKLDN